MKSTILACALKYRHIEVVSPIDFLEDKISTKIRNIATVGFSNSTLSDVFGRGSYVSTKYLNVESLFKNLPNILIFNSNLISYRQ